MKLFYKKVGDNFSLDEYNAMCYLLSLHDYTEKFDLSYDTVTGEYGEYKLDDSNNVLMENTTGFTVVNKQKNFKINISKYISNAQFFVTLYVYKNNTTIEDNNITSTVYSNELYDNIDDSDYEKANLEKVQVQAKNNTITITPSNIGLNNGDWIKKEITITANYTEPILNWEDGVANTEDQIICETFTELEQTITTSPENSHVNIRLKGGHTYKFDKEIIIKNKNVTITGGNTSKTFHAILDGQDLYRHFYVSAGSTLIIRNCNLINGNGSTVYSYLDSPKRGGSIFMNSNFINTSDGYKFNPSFVTIENCVFKNCHANRGGAICNVKGKLTCNNTEFENCVATKDGDRTACWGGAILNESVTMYHDSSNQLYVDKSLTTFATGVTMIDLSISETQNVKNFMDSNYVLPTLKCIHGNNEYTVSSVKTSQFEYLLTINGVLRNGDKFYFKCNDFITRNLKIIKEGSTYYTIVVPDEVD